MTEYVSRSEERTRAIAAGLASDLPAGSVVALRGELGSGKTVFSSGMLSALGVPAPHQSPTFVIMHRYDLPAASAGGIRRVYHIDAYRLDDPTDLSELGFEEWVTDPEGMVLIEWPERLGTLVPPDRLVVALESISESERKIVICRYGRDVPSCGT